MERLDVALAVEFITANQENVAFQAKEENVAFQDLLKHRGKPGKEAGAERASEHMEEAEQNGRAWELEVVQAEQEVAKAELQVINHTPGVGVAEVVQEKFKVAHTKLKAAEVFLVWLKM